MDLQKTFLLGEKYIKEEDYDRALKEFIKLVKVVQPDLMNVIRENGTPEEVKAGAKTLYELISNAIK